MRCSSACAPGGLRHPIRSVRSQSATSSPSTRSLSACTRIAAPHTRYGTRSARCSPERDVTLEVISALAGHVDVRTTQIYVDVTNARKAGASRRSTPRASVGGMRFDASHPGGAVVTTGEARVRKFQLTDRDWLSYDSKACSPPSVREQLRHQITKSFEVQTGEVGYLRFCVLVLGAV